jgi:thioredoxin 1
MRVIEVDKESFDSVVLQSEIPVVVDLWGPKCGPCLALLPQVEELAKEYEGRVAFCKLNVAENRRLVISLKVMGVPTFLFYKAGEIASRITGGEVTPESIRENTEKLLQA